MFDDSTRSTSRNARLSNEKILNSDWKLINGSATPFSLQPNVLASTYQGHGYALDPDMEEA
eukprot:11180899-Lingulodinium_polyedra.AAC.1